MSDTSTSIERAKRLVKKYEDILRLCDHIIKKNPFTTPAHQEAQRTYDNAVTLLAAWRKELQTLEATNTSSNSHQSYKVQPNDQKGTPS